MDGNLINSGFSYDVNNDGVGWHLKTAQTYVNVKACATGVACRRADLPSTV